MLCDSQQLAHLLRALFSPHELRQFVRTLDDAEEMESHLPMNVMAPAELFAETASLFRRWGLSEADLLVKLLDFRPSRARDIVSSHCWRSEPTSSQAMSLDMLASIGAHGVG